MTVSTDLHNWDGENPYHEAFAYAADIVFVSTTALADPETTMRKIVERGRAEVVVATAGAEGAYMLADDEVTHIPAIPPRTPVVDSNGAGDSFAAGFLYGRLSGEPLGRCALYGALVAPTPARCPRPGPTPSAARNSSTRSRSSTAGRPNPRPNPRAPDGQPDAA